MSRPNPNSQSGIRCGQDRRKSWLRHTVRYCAHTHSHTQHGPMQARTRIYKREPTRARTHTAHTHAQTHPPAKQHTHSGRGVGVVRATGPGEHTHACRKAHTDACTGSGCGHTDFTFPSIPAHTHGEWRQTHRQSLPFKRANAPTLLTPRAFGLLPTKGALASFVPQDPGSTLTLAAKLTQRVRISVNNVHLRIEDRQSNPKVCLSPSPFPFKPLSPPPPLPFLHTHAHTQNTYTHRTCAPAHPQSVRPHSCSHPDTRTHTHTHTHTHMRTLLRRWGWRTGC